MKKLLICLALSMVVSVPVFASDVPEMCKTFEELAETTMRARQKNVSIVKMLEINGDDEMSKAMTMDAYEQHTMDYEPYEARQRAEFANKWAMICIKAFGEKELVGGEK